MKCSELNDVRCQGIPYEVYEEIKEHKFGGKSVRTIKVLKIRSALYSRDQGEFECIATNGHAQPAKLIIDLNVLGMYKLKAVFNFCIRTQILLPDTQVFDSMIWKVGKNHVCFMCTRLFLHYAFFWFDNVDANAISTIVPIGEFCYPLPLYLHQGKSFIF